MHRWNIAFHSPSVEAGRNQSVSYDLSQVTEHLRREPKSKAVLQQHKLLKNAFAVAGFFAITHLSRRQSFATLYHC